MSNAHASPPLTVVSRPYPWPWHGEFRPARSALVVCTGDLGILPEPPAWTRLETLLAPAVGAGITVIALPASSTTALPVDAHIVVERPRFGGFTGTCLDLVLRKHELANLIFAGFPFELGADCTMREANDLGYECLALEDCSSGLDPETFAGAISSIQMSGGIFGAVATAREVGERLTAFITPRNSDRRCP